MEAMLFFAAAEASGDGGLLGSLGIDVRLLIVQSIAFLVLLWVLTKFVYPVLASMLDKREATIREGIKAAQDSEKRAEEAMAEVDELLANARKQASAVVASAKNEAAAMIETATTDAAERTERMLKKANDDIEKEVETARKALRDETVSLVALATEKVVGTTVTEAVDKKVIESALKDIKKA